MADIWDELGKLFSGDSQNLTLGIIAEIQKSGPINLNNDAYLGVYKLLSGYVVVASLWAFIVGLSRNRQAIAQGEINLAQSLKNLLLVQLIVWGIPGGVSMISYISGLGAKGVVSWARDQKTLTELLPNGLNPGSIGIGGFMGFMLLFVGILAYGLLQLETQFFLYIVFISTIVLEVSLVSIITKGSLGPKAKTAISYTLVAIFWNLILGLFMVMGTLVINGLNLPVDVRIGMAIGLFAAAVYLPFWLIPRVKSSVNTRVDGLVRTTAGQGVLPRGGSEKGTPAGAPGKSRYVPAPTKGASPASAPKSALQILRETAQGTKADISAARASARARFVQGRNQIVTNKATAARGSINKLVGKATKVLPPQIQAGVQTYKVGKRVLGAVRRASRKNGPPS